MHVFIASVLNTSSWGQKRRCGKKSYKLQWFVALQSWTQLDPSYSSVFSSSYWAVLGITGAAVRTTSQYYKTTAPDGCDSVTEDFLQLPKPCAQEAGTCAEAAVSGLEDAVHVWLQELLCMAQALRKRKFLIQKVIQHTINYIMCQKEETMTISDCQLVIFKEKLNSLMIKNCSCLTFAEKSFKWQNVINWHI